MATIIRKNEEITLTVEEVRSIQQEAHLTYLHYGVEDAVARAEEFDMISFSNYEECDFDDLTSEDEARSVFIDYTVDYIVQTEELYDCGPRSYSDTEFENYVLDCANDLNFRKE